MAMRLSGLMSGMDTESIIQQLVSAKKTKVDTSKKAQTKLEWKQDAWKALNTKLKNLQSKYLSNMRFTDAYSKKTTKVSDPNAVSVITGEDAVNGVQSLKINKLAKTGYLTGASIKGADGTKYNASSKLSELGVSAGGTINVSTKSGTSVDINITENTTISDVLTQLKKAGLNANFDEANQRFFVSSKESGADSDFSITAVDPNGAKALEALGLQEKVNKIDISNLTDADYAKLSATEREYVDFARNYVEVAGDPDATKASTIAKMRTMIDNDVASQMESYRKNLEETKAAAEKKIDELNAKYKDENGNSTWRTEAELTTEIATVEQKLNAAGLSDEDKQKYEKELEALKAEKKDVEDLQAQKNTVAETDEALKQDKLDAHKADLTKETEDRYYNKAEYASKTLSTGIAGGATKVNGQDAEIELNGATFTSSNNTFAINGLTFTALNETNGSQITVTTQQDTDGIYDMVKNFLKEYNAIIIEMDKLYNADSAKGYEPLTTEEKDALSDTEIEEYEKKIKDALLRRDENLNTISSALKSVMSGGIEIGGKTMYLHNFGIETLGYFEAADNEKYAYHIAGDPDDASTSGNADVLKGMIANDPDTVISFFTKLSQNLYDKMSDMSKSVQGYRSFGSFYDDKKMKSDYDDYTTKIKEQEQKLNDYEDKWYKKFAAMESALAKMQSSASAVTSLLGG